MQALPTDDASQILSSTGISGLAAAFMEPMDQFCPRPTHSMQLAGEDSSIDIWCDTTSKNLFSGSFIEPSTPEPVFEHGACPKRRHSLCFNENYANAKGHNFEWSSTCAPVKLEPSHEPCTDDIPWTELVFWLGNANTGKVECSCMACSRSHGPSACRAARRRRGYVPYQRLSSKIPVISLPRIEGVN